MQVDREYRHQGKDDGEGQRDRARDHGARPGAEAHEAHDDDDDDRLPQRCRELADCGVHRHGLVGNQNRFDADRQVGNDVLHRRLDVAAEREDVARLAHRDRDPDGRLPVHAEHRLRRVGIAAPHLGDVAQPDQPIADGEVDGGHVPLGFERAGDAQRKPLLPRLDHASRPHDVLRPAALRQWTSSRARGRQAARSRIRGTICSSCAPMISIFETSGTSSRRDRMSSTKSRSSRCVNPSAVKP